MFAAVDGNCRTQHGKPQEAQRRRFIDPDDWQMQGITRRLAQQKQADHHRQQHRRQHHSHVHEPRACHRAGMQKLSIEYKYVVIRVCGHGYRGLLSHRTTFATDCGRQREFYPRRGRNRGLHIRIYLSLPDRRDPSKSLKLAVYCLHNMDR